MTCRSRERNALMPTALSAAIFYHSLGWRVLPCCSHDHSGMTGFHQRTCLDRGKMPLVAPDQVTTHAIRGWWYAWPSANIGVICGQASGLVRVDIDGAQAQQLLLHWSRGDVPGTWSFTTGPGGRGLLYAWPKDQPCRTTRQRFHGTHHELRLIGDKRHTVLPPSRHASGLVYSWDLGCSPDDLPLSPAPEWLRDLCGLAQPGQRMTPLIKGYLSKKGIFHAQEFVHRTA